MEEKQKKVGKICRKHRSELSGYVCCPFVYLYLYIGNIFHHLLKILFFRIQNYFGRLPIKLAGYFI